MSKQRTNIIIIGAGYAGLLATVRIAAKTRRRNVQITLVNPLETYVERLRLHQYATNQAVKERSIVDLLQGTGVDFVCAEVTTIDAEKREVFVQGEAGSQRLGYDYLLYTAGSTINRDSIPGVREFAYTLTPTGSKSAAALRSALPELDRRGGQVVVVGGGATGIEAAAEFAESYPNLRVSLLTRGEVGHAWGGRIQSYIVKKLPELGVSVREHVTVSQVKLHELATADGETIPYDLCLWAGGFAVPSLARESGLAVNKRGQVLIDPFMRSISHPEIYAAGDSAQPAEETGIPIRMAALTATITGAHAADCLSNAVMGARQNPLSFAYLGQGIALGHHDAVGFNNFPDDKPKWPTFTGWLGYYGRELFVHILADLPGFERRLPGLHYWLGVGKRAPAAAPEARQVTSSRSSV